MYIDKSDFILIIKKHLVDILNFRSGTCISNLEIEFPTNIEMDKIEVKFDYYTSNVGIGNYFDR